MNAWTEYQDSKSNQVNHNLNMLIPLELPSRLLIRIGLSQITSELVASLPETMPEASQEPLPPSPRSLEVPLNGVMPGE